jgi:hypothetical protein
MALLAHYRAAWAADEDSDGFTARYVLDASIQHACRALQRKQLDLRPLRSWRSGQILRASGNLAFAQLAFQRGPLLIIRLEKMASDADRPHFELSIFPGGAGDRRPPDCVPVPVEPNVTVFRDVLVKEIRRAVATLR